MAWDTERTRRLLLDAATAHFSEVGLAGARVDAIARAAGVNKERIYQYFGSKEALFTRVLTDSLAGYLASAEVEGRGPAAVGRFAGRLFDGYDEHPELARLLAWEGLERGGDPVAPDARTAGCAVKAAALQQALPGLDETAARHLLLSVVTVVTGWWSLPQLPSLMLDAPTSADERRAAVVAQVEQMVSRA